MSLKLRLNLALALVLALAIASMVAALLLDAGPRLRNEITSSLKVTEGVVRSSVEALHSSPHPEDALAGLVAGLRNQRHVSVTLATRMPERGNVVPATRKPGASIPAWLLREEERVVRVPVEVGGRSLGTILIAGDGSDEMREVWETIGRITLYGTLFALFAFAVTFFQIRSALSPIEALHEAITHLEEGNYDVEVPRRGPPEIAGIGDHINALAGALNRARDENRRLGTAIVRIQDEERREVARELHDELGPYLFSLRASGTALAGQIGKGQIDPDRIRRDVCTMLERTDALQQTNRRVLQRLSPAGLEELGLAPTLEALADMWRKHQPETALALAIAGPFDDLDATTVLTIYRVVQEGLTNAYRHAGASRIVASVSRRHADASSAAGGIAGIAITVRDDGEGIPEETSDGFGLRGMRERVSALGGTLKVVTADGGGTDLKALIPATSNAWQ